MKNSTLRGTIDIGTTWRSPRAAAAALGVVTLALGCGGNPQSTTGDFGGSFNTGGSGAGGGQGGASGSGNSGGAGGQGGSTTSMGGSGGTTTGSTGMGAGGPAGSLCAKDPPAGAAMPDALPSYSGGDCPSLVAGENTFSTGGVARKFLLLFPADLKPEERPPILFLWHWLGGDAEGFVDKGDVQNAVDQQRFVAVVPRAKGDLQFQWPFSSADSDARMNEELEFFDDMLTCVASAYQANTSCVASVGVSAGALFTDQLAGHRAQYLSSFLSFSGGVGGFIKPWANPSHKLPGLVLWGGPTDNCLGLLSFDQLSNTLEDKLKSEGNFFVECIHNCGHSAPPLEPPADGSSLFSPMWDFAFNHPFWLKAGESPYKDSGLPAAMPEWCAIGKGSATPRVGPCSGGGC